jgi:hypothetical protein
MADPGRRRTLVAGTATPGDHEIVLIVLDSLGVIFRTRDGWPAHLTRFVAAKGGVRAESERDRFVANYFASIEHRGG